VLLRDLYPQNLDLVEPGHEEEAAEQKTENIPSTSLQLLKFALLCIKF